MENNEDQYPSQTLLRLRKDIIEKRKELQSTHELFLRLSEGEKDSFRRVIDKMIAKYASIMEDLFTNIEALAYAQVALRDQLDTIKDVVVEIHDVNGNPEMLRKIDKSFNHYTDSH